MQDCVFCCFLGEAILAGLIQVVCTQLMMVSLQSFLWNVETDSQTSLGSTWNILSLAHSFGVGALRKFWVDHPQITDPWRKEGNFWGSKGDTFQLYRLKSRTPMKLVECGGDPFWRNSLTSLKPANLMEKIDESKFYDQFLDFGANPLNEGGKHCFWRETTKFVEWRSVDCGHTIYPKIKLWDVQLR